MTKNTKNGTREMVFSIISQYFKEAPKDFSESDPDSHQSRDRFLPLNASIKVVSVFGDVPEAAEDTR